MSDLLKRLRDLETKLPTSSDNWIEAREVLLEAADCIESSNATAFAAGVEAAAKEAKSAWLKIHGADHVDANVMDEFWRQLSITLSPQTGMVMVPAVPTEAMWGNDLVRALILWQRMDYSSPQEFFKHCSSCGVKVPQWIKDEPEMTNYTHTTSKGTVAVLIYRAMIEAATSAKEPPHD